MNEIKNQPEFAIAAYDAGLDSVVDGVSHAMPKRGRRNSCDDVVFKAIAFQYFRSNERGQTLRNEREPSERRWSRKLWSFRDARCRRVAVDWQRSNNRRNNSFFGRGRRCTITKIAFCGQR